MVGVIEVYEALRRSRSMSRDDILFLALRRLCHDTLRGVTGHLVISAESARVNCAPLRHRLQRTAVQMKLGMWDDRADTCASGR